MFSTDTGQRALELLERITGAFKPSIPPSAKQDTAARTLDIAERLAKRLKIIPFGIGEMATVTTSIGTASRDYSTIASWEADLDNSGVYSSGDDAVGECYADSTFSEHSIAINGGGTVGLNSAVLSAAASERHDGTFNTGAQIVVSHSGYIFDSIASRSRVEWLCIENTQANGRCVDLDGTTDGSVSLANCIISPRGGSQAVVIANSASTDVKVVNTIIFRGLDIRIINGADAEFYNCTIFGSTSYGLRRAGSSTVRAYNTISVSNSSEDYSNTTDEQYCISDDGTAAGTGSITSTSANLFVSTASGTEDFHLKTGADAIGAGFDYGTTPAGVEIDIDGRDRDAEGDTWDIGADQFVTVSGGQTINLAIVSESNTANGLAIIKPVRIEVSPVAESETVSPLQVIAPKTVAITAVTESETLAGLSITNPRTYTLGQAFESEQANGLDIITANVVLLGQVSESGIVHNLEIGNPRTYEVGQVSEAESVGSLVINSAQTVTLQRVTETESVNALLIGGDQTIALSPVSEANTANALVIGQDKTITLTQVSESESLGLLTITVGSIVPAGFIYISDASISVPEASASIAVSKATGTIQA